MAIVNTNTAPILQEGTNITLTQTGQTITITATDTTNAPGGSNTQVQFNDSGVFGGDAGLTYNKTTNVVSLESVDFATTPAAADAERRLKWDNDEGSLVLTLKGGNVTIPIGAEVVSLVYNAEATTLAKGEVVYVFGAQGQRISVKRAVNTSDATSAQTLGVIAESIAAGAEGFCMVQGMIRGIDTSAYVQGDTLYLSATAGQFTKTKPVAPNHLVYVGFAVKVNASSGEIFVRPQNGYEMDEIHDYLEGSVQNNDVISYESSSGLYKPKSIPTLLGYTPANQATTITINGTSYDLSANRTWSVGTVTSVGITAGTGINVSGSPIIGSGSITVTNSAPDQTVVLTAGSGISISGTYPSFTITNTGSSGITGSGTSGYVTYWDGTSSITGESNLFWDATNDRLGIGIATPSYLLDISSSSDPILGLYRTTNSVGFGIGRINWDGQNSSSTRVNYGRIQTEIASNTAGSHSGNLIFYTAGSGTVSSRMIISGDGNLGLGVTPSAWDSGQKVLQVGLGAFYGLADGGATVVVNNAYYNSGWKYSSSSSAGLYQIVQNSHQWFTAPSGTAGNAITFTQAMTLNASGNLGLGVTPSSWGSVFRALEGGDGDNQGYFAFQTNANAIKTGVNHYFDGSNYVYKFSSSPASRYDINTDNFIWNLAGSGTAGNTISFTQAMTLNASGQLAIGTTSNAWGSAFKSIQIGTGLSALSDSSGRATYLSNNWYYDTGDKYMAAYQATLYYQYLGAHNWLTAGTGSAGAALTWTQAMTLDSSGNLGVRATSMSYPLTRNGITLKASGTDGAEFVILSSADTGFTGAALIRSGADFSVYNRTNGVLAFGTNDTTRMTITSGGNVGIANTSPTATLQIGTGIGTFDGLAIGAAANRDIRIGQSSTNNLVIAWKYNATAASAYALIETFGGSNNLILQGTGGNVAIGNTSPSEKLDVTGGIASNSGTIKTVMSYSDIGIIGTTSNHSLQIITNNSDRIRITSGGNVAIGDTNANARLKVAGNGASGEIAGFRNVIYLYNTNTTSNQSNGIVFGSAGTGNAGTFALYTDLSADGTGVADLSFYNTAERMKISSTGNVGINTTSPSAKLVVEDGVANQTGAPTYRGSMIISNGGGTTSTSGGLEFHAASSGSGYGWRVSTPDLGFGNIPVSYQSRTNNASWTERLRLNTSGQLQLNNYTSSTSFSGTAAGYLAFDSSGNVITTSGTGGITGSGTSGTFPIFNGTTSVTNSGFSVSSGIVFFNNALTYTQFIFDDDSGSRVVIDNKHTFSTRTGSSGLTDVLTLWADRGGVTNPSTGIGSSLNFNVSLTTSSVGNLGSIGFVSTNIPNETGDFYITTRNAGSATEKLRVTSGGNVGIGTTTPKLNANSGTFLTVENSTANGWLELSTASTTDGVGGGITFNNTNIVGSDKRNAQINAGRDGANNSAYISFYTWSAGTLGERIRIASNGEVYVAGTTDQGAYNLQCNGTGVWGAGAYVNGSDIRLKENIESITKGIDLVTKLKPVSFNYIESYSKDRSIQTGFIAQDLLEVFKDEKYIDGIVSKGTNHYNVAYQNLIPILVKAIQEQQEQINQLKNGI